MSEAMLFTCAESSGGARTKYGILSEVREGLVAVNDTMGTWVKFPRLDMKTASDDFWGPMMACTLYFSSNSIAVRRANERK